MRVAMYLMARAGHLCFAERPEEYNRVLMTFAS